MARFGLIGGSYSSQSVIADCQRTMNWYVENIESQMGAAAAALYPTPGLTVFSTIAQPVRGEIEINGRMFAVGGGSFYEIHADGTSTNKGSVGNDLQLVTMATNGTLGNQVIICSAGALYVFGLASNTLTQIGGLTGTPAMVVYCSSYFVALLAGTNKFQVSNLLDGSTWNPLSVQQNEVFPENISTLVSAYGFLFVLGQDGHSQVYYDSGANQFTPFTPISGAYMEEGCGAPNSPVVMDNTVFWVGGRGGKGDIAWRANGYTPARVSTYAEETAWASYPAKGSDAVGYTYRDQGHTFWVLDFPLRTTDLGRRGFMTRRLSSGTSGASGRSKGLPATALISRLVMCFASASILSAIGTPATSIRSRSRRFMTTIQSSGVGGALRILRPSGRESSSSGCRSTWR